MGTLIYSQSVRSTGDNVDLQLSLKGTGWSLPLNLWDLTLSLGEAVSEPSWLMGQPAGVGESLLIWRHLVFPNTGIGTRTKLKRAKLKTHLLWEEGINFSKQAHRHLPSRPLE